MAVVQYFNLAGEALGLPVDAASYVRAPLIGDLVFVRQNNGGQPERMQVAGAEHRSFRQDGGLVPALALFVVPYRESTKAKIADVPVGANLGLPDGH